VHGELVAQRSLRLGPCRLCVERIQGSGWELLRLRRYSPEYHLVAFVNDQVRGQHFATSDAVWKPSVVCYELLKRARPIIWRGPSRLHNSLKNASIGMGSWQRSEFSAQIWLTCVFLFICLLDCEINMLLTFGTALVCHGKFRTSAGSDTVKIKLHCKFFCADVYIKISVKQSLYWPGESLRIPGGWGSQISRQSAHEGRKIASPTHRPLLHPRKYSWYCFNPRARVRRYKFGYERRNKFLNVIYRNYLRSLKLKPFFRP
jgi:hypothetical protein